MVDSLFNHTWTEGGWASIRSVATMEQEDHMWVLAVRAFPPVVSTEGCLEHCESGPFAKKLDAACAQQPDSISVARGVICLSA